MGHLGGAKELINVTRRALGVKGAGTPLLLYTGLMRTLGLVAYHTCLIVRLRVFSCSFACLLAPVDSNFLFCFCTCVFFLTCRFFLERTHSGSWRMALTSTIGLLFCSWLFFYGCFYCRRECCQIPLLTNYWFIWATNGPYISEKSDMNWFRFPVFSACTGDGNPSFGARGPSRNSGAEACRVPCDDGVHPRPE